MWHGGVGGYLILVSIILLCLATFCPGLSLLSLTQSTISWSVHRTVTSSIKAEPVFSSGRANRPLKGRKSGPWRMPRWSITTATAVAAIKLDSLLSIEGFFIALKQSLGFKGQSKMSCASSVSIYQNLNYCCWIRVSLKQNLYGPFRIQGWGFGFSFVWSPERVRKASAVFKTTVGSS